jgi:hypothetical protein
MRGCGGPKHLSITQEDLTAPVVEKLKKTQCTSLEGKRKPRQTLTEGYVKFPRFTYRSGKYPQNIIFINRMLF